MKLHGMLDKVFSNLHMKSDQLENYTQLQIHFATKVESKNQNAELPDEQICCI